MLIRSLGSGLLAAVLGSLGVVNAERLEKKVAGGKALSVRGLIARHTVMAAAFRAMKEHRSTK